MCYHDFQIDHTSVIVHRLLALDLICWIHARQVMPAKFEQYIYTWTRRQARRSIYRFNIYSLYLFLYLCWLAELGLVNEAGWATS